MPKVLTKDERKFWKQLCKAFQSLLDKFTSGEKHSVEYEVNNFTMSTEVENYLDRAINDMVTHQRVLSARSWREAAAKGGKGRLIYDLISKEMKGPVGRVVWEQILNNSNYIKTLPAVWASYASQYAYRAAVAGRRPEDVEAELRRVMPAHITKNLKCIARTELAKANAAIVEARAEMCGIKAYIWRSVSDERTRTSHEKMDGVLVFYDDPPSPEALFPSKGQSAYGNYHAGNTFNCRCYQEPVVDWRFLPDSIRVYRNGSIKTMTREAIIREYGHAA